MALRQVFVQFQSNVGTLTSAFQSAERSALSSATAIGKVAGIAGIALGAAFASAAASAIGFQSKLNAISVVSDSASAHINEIGKQLLSLSMAIPVSLGDLELAFEQAERAGFHGASAMNLITQAARGAVIAAEGGVAGGHAVTDMTRTLTGVLNDYGMSANEAVNVQNILNVAFKNSSGSYQQLADSLRTAAPIASESGIKINEVAGALAVMSRNGVEAGQTGMVFNRFLLQMIRPAGEMNEAVKSLTDATHKNGFETAGAALQALGLQGVLRGLVDQVGGSVDKFVILNPSIRSARGLLALIANDGTNFTDVLKQMNDETQIAIDSAKMYETASKSMSNQIQLAKNDFKAASTELGQALLPAVSFITERVGGMAIQFTNLSGPMKTIVAIAGLTTAVLLTLLGAAAILAPGFVALSGAMAGASIAGFALDAALAPITIGLTVIAGILAVVAGLHFLSGKATFEHAQRVEQLTDAYKAEEEGQRGSIDAAIASDLAHQKLFDTLQKIGISNFDLVNLYKGGKEATDAYSTSIDAFSQKIGFSTEVFKKLPLKQQQEEWDQLKKALDGNTDAAAQLNKEFGTTRGHFGNMSVFGDNKQATKEMKEALKDLGLVSQGIDDNRKAQQAHDQEMQRDAQATHATKLQLLEYGDVIGNTTGDIVKLTKEQENLRDSLKAFVGAEAEFKAAQDGLSKSMGAFVSVNEIASNIISEKQQAMADNARASSVDYKQALKDDTRAAQDRARDITRANADMLGELRQQNEAGANSVSAPIAGFQVGRSADEMQLLAQNASNERNARKAQIDAMKQQFTEENRAAQDTARDVSRSNSDLAASYHVSREKAVLTLSDFLSKITVEAQKNKKWNDDLNKITEMGGQQFADTLRKMGKDGVQLVSEIASGINKDAIPKLKEAFAQLDPTTDVSFNAFAAGISGQNKAAQKWEHNLAELASSSMHSLRLKFIELGPKAAETLADTVDEIHKGHIDKVKEADKEAADSLAILTDAAVQTFDEQMSLLEKIGQQHGLGAMQEIAKALGLGLNDSQIGMIADKLATDLNVPLSMTVDIIPALDKEQARLAGLDPAIFDPPTPVPSEGTLPSSRRMAEPTASPGAIEQSHPHYGNAPRARLAADGLITTEDHQAQISPAVMRVWAEPETGGEAYIPLHPTKRARSEQILETVAKMFGYNVKGYANGGIHTGQFDGHKIVEGLKQIVSSVIGKTVFPWQITALMRAQQFKQGIMGPGGVTIPTGPVSGNLVQWLTAAIGLTGVPPNWLNPLETIAMHESTGDPHAANRTAAGIAAGSPEGLMQCVPLDTEILTKEGWKKYNEVKIGDETLGFNPETQKNEWTKITKVVYHETGQVWKIGNAHWSVRVTPNHRWWSEPKITKTKRSKICPDCNTSWKTEKGMETHFGKKHHKKLERALVYSGRFVTTDSFKANDRIRLAAEASTNEGIAISTDEAKIVAWLQGDGHITDNYTSFDGIIYQSKPRMIEKIRELLKTVPHTERSRQRKKGYLCAHEFRLRREYVTELFKRAELRERGVENFVLGLNGDQREAWLEAIIDAEGNRQKGIKENYSDSIRISQNDGEIQEAIILAIYLSGARPTLSKLTRYKNNHRPGKNIGICSAHIYPLKFNTPVIEEDQPVWCVKTDLETWTMKQDGKIMLTGNTVINTFRAYMLPGHGDIWNPIDNAAAAIRYIQSRYKDPWNTPGIKSMMRGGPYTNYAEGGINFGVYDRGGILPPGLTVAYNGTNRNETVSTHSISPDMIEHAVNRAVQSAVRELRERDRIAAPVIIEHPTPVHAQHLANEIAWIRR
jgi:TP901 family phage tail tape measure protein